MTPPAYPSLRTDRLNAFVRLRASGINAPDHALVKEFIREYLGPEFATRAIIRTVAERLTGSDDALIGTVLELAHAGGSTIEPADVLGLLEAAPRLPCAPVLGREDHFRALRTDVLSRYDRVTTLRVLHSILNTAAKATARRIELPYHSEESFRYSLAHRDERTVESIIRQIRTDLPTALIEPLVELIPQLNGEDSRDRMFAAALTTQPLVANQFSDDALRQILSRAWEIGSSNAHQSVMEALRNPGIALRLPDAAKRWILNGLDSRDLILRAAALRTLAAEENRSLLQGDAGRAMRRALRRYHVAPLHAVLDVVAASGPTVLGPHGAHKLRIRLDRWTRSSNTTLHLVAMRALESDEIRVMLGPVSVQRAMEELQKSPAPGLGSRVLGVQQAITQPPPGTRPATISPTSRATQHGREQLVTAVATAVAPRSPGQPLPPANAVHSWRDLDPDLDVPFDLPGVAGLLDGTTVRADDASDYVVHVLHTPRAVLDNAAWFRNCTKSWPGQLNSGRHVLVFIEDHAGRPVYNADWHLAESGWVLNDCLARFNEPHVPESIWMELHALTDELNAARELRRPAGPDVTADEVRRL